MKQKPANPEAEPRSGSPNDTCAVADAEPGAAANGPGESPEPNWRKLDTDSAEIATLALDDFGGNRMRQLGFTRGDGVSTLETNIVRGDAVCALAEETLNALIAECYFQMKEVAFRSMCQTIDANDRKRFMDSAMDFAKTGAVVANAIALLRGGAPVQETCQRVIVEHVERTAMPPKGEGGAVAR
ncbi:MAG: hypothetical protein ACREHE_12705 [Rhizomicrobium sp.]